MKTKTDNKTASHHFHILPDESMGWELDLPLSGRMSRRILALGIALMAASAAVHGQPWETVDDIVDPSSVAYAATSDSAGNLFVAGTMKEASGLQHAVVMKSIDGGQTWDSDPSTPGVDEPADATAPPSDYSYAGFHAITCARTTTGEEHLVSVGRDGRVASGPDFPWSLHLNGRWIVRRSLDGGATWTTLDQFTHPTYNLLPTWNGPWGAAVDNHGNIYVAGSADENVVTVKRGITTTTTVSRWLIRKGLSTADGMVWSTVGDFAGTTVNQWDNQTTCPRGIACVGNDVFVVGSSGGSWVVRKSSNGGSTWSVVDNFRFSTSNDSHAFGIAADTQGNVFVVGEGIRTVTSGKGNNATTVTDQFWIVRKGTGAGTSWTTVDQFQYPNGSAQARGVTVDGNNDVHVTGSAWSAASSSLRHWITRQRSAVTGLWSTTDDYSMASNGSSGANAITADPFGNLFAAGGASDSAGVSHGWLVRRKPSP